MRSHVLWSCLLLMVGACGNVTAPPPTAPPVETPTPAPIPTETSAESAQTALTEQRYEEVCAYLVTVRFSPVVCDFIVASANGEGGRLPLLTGWLESHHVRLLSGRMFGMRLGEDETWNIEVDGERAIMHAALTADEFLANDFEFVSQRVGAREITMHDGSSIEVAVFREWPLEFMLRDLARLPAERRPRQARELLAHLLAAWVERYAAADGSSEGAREAPPAPTSPFAGTWFSTNNAEVRLVLTDTTYLFRFPFEGGLRRIYADIVDTNLEERHVTLRITRVTQDGDPVEFAPGLRFMTYELRGSILMRRVSADGFPSDVEEVMYMRIPESMVGPHDQ